MFSGLKDTHLLMCGCVSNLETLYLDTWPTHNAPTACSGFGLKRVKSAIDNFAIKSSRVGVDGLLDYNAFATIFGHVLLDATPNQGNYEDCEDEQEDFAHNATAKQLLELQDRSTILALLRLLATATRTERVSLSRFDCGYTLSAFVLGQLELVSKVFKVRFLVHFSPAIRTREMIVVAIQIPAARLMP